MLKTPANAGAKGYTQKGVGCLLFDKYILEHTDAKLVLNARKAPFPGEF